MSKNLTDILKRAKAVDARTKEKFDKAGVKPQSKGLMSEMDGNSLISIEEAAQQGFDIPVQSIHKNKPVIDVYSEEYTQNVQSSKLPEAVKKAMLTTPIPQVTPTSLGGSAFDVDEDMIHEINGGRPVKKQIIKEYDEMDERDFNDVRVDKNPSKRLSEAYKKSNSENKKLNISEEYLVKLIDSRLQKILPSIVEEYFDSRVISEQIQVKVGNTIFSGNLKPLPKK